MSAQPFDIKRPPRTFLPADFSFDSWEDLKPWFDKLEAFDLLDLPTLKHWLKYLSEVEAVIEENAGWRYIRMSTDTNSEEKRDSYTKFVTEIQPELEPVMNRLNKKLIESPALEALEGREYEIMVRSVRTSLELFREENIPLQAKLRNKAQEYGSITGAWTIEWEGEEITLQQASLILKRQDREKRQKAWTAINDARMQDAEKLDELYNELVELRHQVALNAGFSNYRDYKFKELGRFDYSVSDCFDFHDSIRESILPLVKEQVKDRQDKLGYDTLRPWDMSVDPEGKDPLHPFKDGKELTDVSIEAFDKIDPYFGGCIATMDKLGHLDLDSRKGKAPGGYNYPLYEIGVPFIFMNAVGSHRDLVTMFHEGGHAIHSFLTRNLELTGFKGTPSEVAELASMTMELVSMDEWHRFYKNEEELMRAKREQIKTSVSILPWIALIDHYQHRVYERPEMNISERHQLWLDLESQYDSGLVNWDGLEQYKPTSWHRQLHLFEVPFYYIEYGMAQLGAIAVWRNYRNDPKQAMDQYRNALKLGYTRSIPEIYETAGIKFDFSREYVAELVSFMNDELDKVS